VNRKKNICK